MGHYSQSHPQAVRRRHTRGFDASFFPVGSVSFRPSQVRIRANCRTLHKASFSHMLRTIRRMGESVETAPFVAARKSPALPVALRPGGWLLLLLLIWLYHSILFRLAVQWWTDPDFSHGFFVPAFALFVLWQDRHRLASIQPAPSWSGLPIIVFSLGMLIFGVLGVELFTSRSSLLILVASVIILFRGWPWFRAVLFPWRSLPYDSAARHHPAACHFSTPVIRLQSSDLVHRGLGMTASRTGNLIELPHITLEVAAACSGIRSLVSLITPPSSTAT